MRTIRLFLAVALLLTAACAEDPPRVGAHGPESIPGQAALQKIEEDDQANAPTLGSDSPEPSQADDSKPVESKPVGDASEAKDERGREISIFGGRHQSDDGEALYCSGVVTCSQSCAVDDARCVDACVDQGSEFTGAAAQALADCVCEDEACTSCEYAAMTCYLDGSPLGCGGFVDCVATCETDGCRTACVENLTGEGAAYLDSLTQCMNDYCGGSYCDDCEEEGDRCLAN